MQQRLRKKSIFRSLFMPLFLTMILQASIFYFAAINGGIEDTLTRNVSGTFSDRVVSRKNEIESKVANRWTQLEACDLSLDEIYAQYESSSGSRPLLDNAEAQISFLGDCADTLVETLRQNEVNGIFLIINDSPDRESLAAGETSQKYGLCIRDLNQESNYSGRTDLLIERAPSSIVDAMGCSLDSWWEAKYSFASEEQGDFFYSPLNAAWDNPGAEGKSLAYFSGIYRLSGSDSAMISYSLPLFDRNGFPYAVLGVELSETYLASLLPNRELSDADKSCYVLAVQQEGASEYIPLVSSGVLFDRCFASDAAIACCETEPTGGFTVRGRDGVKLYGNAAEFNIYSNNSPFEGNQPVLVALANYDTMFAYIDYIKLSLFIVALLSLMLGILGIIMVSRRFASPITALAKRVRCMKSSENYELGRLGVAEIDQLVESIEELNRNVSKNSARTEFFSRMSHDMRTPMNAIISFSSPELLEGANEAVKDDYLNKIYSSGKYLLDLINEVLDMTKIESNKTDLRLAPMQASRLVETVSPIIEKLAEQKEIRFVTELALDRDIYIEADEAHLNQIVMNLLSNAVKFTPSGGFVALRADMSAPDEKGKVLCSIVVEDNGIGMGEDFMENLYTPFEQENSSREGTGLGLSISKKLVELMGGSIDCVSRKNIGTVFTVKIPFDTVCAPSAEGGSKSPQTVDSGRLRGKRILVCEDNRLNMQIISQLLEKAGMSVEKAEDGSVCADMFEASDEGHFDAILMDIQMPVMDGLTATRLIRSFDRADAKTVPILAMTANAFDEDVRACLDAGMNEHLSKPIEPKKVFEALIRYICQ